MDSRWLCQLVADEVFLHGSSEGAWEAEELFFCRSSYFAWSSWVRYRGRRYLRAMFARRMTTPGALVQYRIQHNCRGHTVHTCVHVCLACRSLLKTLLACRSLHFAQQAHGLPPPAPRLGRR